MYVSFGAVWLEPWGYITALSWRQLVALGALAGLGGMLLAVCWNDIRHRRIANGLCLAVALSALPWWIGAADTIGRLGEQLLLFACAAPVLLALFALRAVGGGDAKLALALMLWIPASRLWEMIVGTALCGAGLGLVVLAHSLWTGRRGTVPYGVALACGAALALIRQGVI